jgi:hypothetical protein
MMNDVHPAETVARKVPAPALAANSNLPSVIPYELPALKAIHPHHKMNMPMHAINGSFNGAGLDPFSNLPILGPMYHAPKNAAVPPVIY